MLLEAKKGDFTDVKINLRSSFMTLREHIQEAHGGYVLTRSAMGPANPPIWRPQ